MSLTDLFHAESDWRHAAACRVYDPELWWTESHHDSRAKAAVEICERCPVRQECLTHAFQAPEHEGIWGGTYAYERRRVRARSRVGVA